MQTLMIGFKINKLFECLHVKRPHCIQKLYEILKKVLFTPY